MPRLVSRGTGALPDYEPPSCALNAAACDALATLSEHRGVHIYEAQLKDVVRQLGHGVGDINERLITQRERLEALHKRRLEKASAKTDEETRLEAHVLEFEGKVDALTREAEHAVRDVIDKKMELEDEAAVVADIHTAAVTRGIEASARRRQRRAQDEEEQGDGAEQDEKHDPASSTLDDFRERSALKLAEYNDQLTPAQRYAHNNDYASFKKLWHDAAAGDNGPALPEASKWFRSNGRPVMDRPDAGPRRGTVESGTEDDDDVVVSREVLSTNCPLTLRPMDQPYSNSKCKHTFELAAIREYLPRQGNVQCPQTGCAETFSRASFDEDFYLDHAMLRRIERSKRIKRDGDMEEEDVDSDATEGVVRGQRSVRGAAPKAERLSMNGAT